MKQRLVLLISMSCLLISSLAPNSVAAQAAAQTHGLFITPLRQYLKIAAGSTVHSSLKVTNLTAKPMDVHLSVQQFSLTDYTYNYQFTQPENTWLHIATTDVTLQPQHAQTISYDLNVPAGTAPGGYYYTLLASANLKSQGIDSTIQAADLLYLTVAGKLLYTSQLRTSSIGRFSFGQPFTYQLSALNTGNIYFFAYTSGHLNGWSAKPALSAEAHMLVPDTIRKLSGSISPPVLPGIYTATYGYRTDNNQMVTRKSRVVFIPPWSIAFVLALLLIFGSWLRKRRAHERQMPKSTTNLS